MELGCFSSKARSVFALFINANGVLGNVSSALIISLSFSLSSACGRFLLDCKGTPKSLGGLLSPASLLNAISDAADVVLGAVVVDNGEISLRLLLMQWLGRVLGAESVMCCSVFLAAWVVTGTANGIEEGSTVQLEGGSLLARICAER